MVHKLNVFEIQTSVFVEISEEDFRKYEKVRLSGETNMFDFKRVIGLSGLPDEKVRAITFHYEELMKLYPKVRETK